MATPINLWIIFIWTKNITKKSPIIFFDDIDVIFTDLNSQSKGAIDKKYFTCFNKGGVDIDGKAFMKKVSVKKGEVQSLWFGLEILEGSTV